MSEPINDGGPIMSNYDTSGEPAFPHDVGRGHRGFCEAADGITVRQLYAMFAMHAQIIAAGMTEDSARSLTDAAESLGKTVHQQIAYCANVMADAMLAERAKR